MSDQVFIEHPTAGIGSVGRRALTNVLADKGWTEIAEWSAGTTYAIGDRVEHERAVWTASAGSVGEEPDHYSDYWTLTLPGAGDGAPAWTPAGHLTDPDAHSDAWTPAAHLTDPDAHSTQGQITAAVADHAAAPDAHSGTFALAAYPLRQVFKKVDAIAQGTPSRVKWLTMFDSMGQLKFQHYVQHLKRWLGGQPGAYFSGSSQYSSVSTNATTGSVTERTTDFDVWPSGLAYLFATGASRTYGLGGGSATCDTIKVFYAKGPASATDGGNFKLQVDGVDQASYLNVSTLDAALGVGIITLNPTLGAHTLTVVCNTGPVRIIGVGFEDSTSSGIVPINIGQGGIALNSPTATAWANFQAVIADLDPDVLQFEAKEESSYLATALDDLLDAATTGSPTMDVLLIGSSPRNTGDADQQAQNTILRNAASARDLVYWDGYTPLVDFATVDALGWATDPIHLDAPAQRFLSSLMLEDLGLFRMLGRRNPFDVAALNAMVYTTLKFGPRDDATAAQTSTDASGNDLSWKIKRWLRFFNEAGTTEYMRLVLDGATEGWLPPSMKFGQGNAGFNGAAADKVSARNGGTWSGFADVEGRSMVTVRNTATHSSAGGALTVDFSARGWQEITLAANTGAVSFSGGAYTGQRFILSLLQDGTGSRTVGSWNAAIKWAGSAPTLTTTANKRDVFEFIYAGGNYYEVNRSLNVG